MNNKQVAELFIEQHVLQPSQADDVLNEAQLNGKTIAQAMVDSGFVDERGFYQTIADGLGTEYVDLNEKEIAPKIVRLIPGGLARLHRALPIGMSGNTLRVALVDPLDLRATEDLRFALGKDVDVVVASAEQIEDRIKQYYGTDTSSMEEILKQLGEAGELLQLHKGEGAVAVEAEANATPIIRFVDLILYQAIQDRASDIHFEPFENEFKIRYRVDGALYEMPPPPRHLALPVISRVKVMANMNIAERRLPQDGRIQKNIGGRLVDLRVSTLPTQFGESLVLRVLDRTTVNLDLEMLGMPDYIHDYVLEVIQRPNGIFIATGPTGSGKTTTLYSCLRRICQQCRTTYEPNEALLAQLEISQRDIGAKKFYCGKGCDACNNTGFKGRKGIYELMKITDPLRELINERAPTVVLRQKAVELGMVTLRQDGLRSIFAGDTTIEEVLKYT